MGTTFKSVPRNEKSKKYIICVLLYPNFAQLLSVVSPSPSCSRIAFTEMNPHSLGSSILLCILRSFWGRKLAYAIQWLSVVSVINTRMAKKSFQPEKTQAPIIRLSCFMFVPDVTNVSQLVIHGNAATDWQELQHMTHAVPSQSQSSQSIPKVQTSIKQMVRQPKYLTTGW